MSDPIELTLDAIADIILEANDEFYYVDMPFVELRIPGRDETQWGTLCNPGWNELPFLTIRVRHVRPGSAEFRVIINRMTVVGGYGRLLLDAVYDSDGDGSDLAGGICAMMRKIRR